MLLEYLILFLIILGALLIGLNIGGRLRKIKKDKHRETRKKNS